MKKVKKAYVEVVRLTRMLCHSEPEETIRNQANITSKAIDNSHRDFDCREFLGCIKETMTDEFPNLDALEVTTCIKELLARYESEHVKHNDRFREIQRTSIF